MRLLLDTQILLWTLVAAPKLPLAARGLIADPQHEKVVSSVSIFEIAVKFARNRGRPDDMPISGREALRLCAAAETTWLALLPEHAAKVDELPPHHRDPFDRLLVAQALQEPLRLVTADRELAAYSDTVIVV